MDEQEQVVINLIVNSGSARSSAIEAIQYAKAGDMAKAEESLQNAKETVNKLINGTCSRPLNDCISCY